jgi:hypothetical protein
MKSPQTQEQSPHVMLPAEGDPNQSQIRWRRCNLKNAVDDEEEIPCLSCPLVPDLGWQILFRAHWDWAGKRHLIEAEREAC